MDVQLSELNLLDLYILLLYCTEKNTGTGKQLCNCWFLSWLTRRPEKGGCTLAPKHRGISTEYKTLHRIIQYSSKRIGFIQIKPVRYTVFPSSATNVFHLNLHMNITENKKNNDIYYVTRCLVM
jgi:hypothetical protein